MSAVHSFIVWNIKVKFEIASGTSNTQIASLYSELSFFFFFYHVLCTWVGVTPFTLCLAVEQSNSELRELLLWEVFTTRLQLRHNLQWRIVHNSKCKAAIIGIWRVSSLFSLKFKSPKFMAKRTPYTHSKQLPLKWWRTLRSSLHEQYTYTWLSKPSLESQAVL